ncbi:hypothetical protein Tco_1281109 [Tanacetum coccineum]
MVEVVIMVKVVDGSIKNVIQEGCDGDKEGMQGFQSEENVGSFGDGVGDEKVVVGEGVVVTSSSLEMLTNSCLGGIMVSLIFLEGLEEEA